MTIHGDVTVSASAMVDFVVEYMNAYGDWEHIAVPESVDERDATRKVSARNVERIETDDDKVRVMGSFQVQEVVNRIPATRINPPEYETEPVDMIFSIELHLQDVPEVSGVIEYA